MCTADNDGSHVYGYDDVHATLGKSDEVVYVKVFF